MNGPHPSHRTKISLDASSYDEICVLCGARDELMGWGSLVNECNGTEEERAAYDKTREPIITPEALEKVQTELRAPDVPEIHKLEIECPDCGATLLITAREPLADLRIEFVKHKH